MEEAQYDYQLSFLFLKQRHHQKASTTEFDNYYERFPSRIYVGDSYKAPAESKKGFVYVKKIQSNNDIIYLIELISLQ